MRLRDGSQLAIRPIEPDDREELRRGFERLSPESRYRRFFGPMPTLRERDLDYLTNVDHHDHEALIAFDEATGKGVGVARYVRIGEGVAEPAIAVADEWQGRGVARPLLDALVDRARAEGIRRFEAPILAGNKPAIRLFERLGPTTIEHAGREVELHIDLPGTTKRRRALLRPVLTPAKALRDRFRTRRRGAPDAPRRNVIVVGTDGSDHARAAVETAAELAGALGAALHVVGAHRFFVPERADVAAAVADAAADLRGRGLHVHEEVRRGDPALVLSDVATDRDARLIVVGAGERGKAARRLMGSVADLVSERAPCNVLVVRPPDRVAPP